MAATSVLTLAGWNDLLTRINNLAKSPPAGCKALDALLLVTAPHRWSTSDIAAARNKLSAICSSNVFSAPTTGVWMKSVIDELNTAIRKGWCKCQQACCVPGGPHGWEGPQAVEQYLYGNISYSAAAAVIGADAMTNLAACVGGTTGQIIRYTQRHLHSTNCIYQDRWTDNNAIRQVGGQDEYWYTCGNTNSTVVGSGWVPSFTPSYASSTATGEHNYYDQPLGMGTSYDYQANRYYQTFWIGAFDMDAYVYELSVTSVCP